MKVNEVFGALAQNKPLALLKLGARIEQQFLLVADRGYLCVYGFAGPAQGAPLILAGVMTFSLESLRRLLANYGSGMVLTADRAEYDAAMKYVPAPDGNYVEPLTSIKWADISALLAANPGTVVVLSRAAGFIALTAV